MTIPAKGPIYSVVIPVYNSEKIVENTVAETVNFFEEQGLNYQLVLVNDHSKDNSWVKVEGLAKKNSNILAINLLKNYGQHSAVYCGLKYGTGDYFITMDDDLQNPPQEIIHLINRIHEGYDLVFAKFRQKQHGLLRKLGTKVVGYLNKKIFNKPKNITLTNFRIFNKEVARRVSEHKTFYPYIPGLLLMYSSQIANIETEHHARPIGKSNYTILTIMKLVGRLLFNYSSYPLKLLTSIGFVISLLSFLVGVFVILNSILVGTSVRGWTTLAVLTSFLNGFIIIMLGVMGEYITRLMNQVSVAEAFQVKEIIND